MLPAIGSHHQHRGGGGSQRGSISSSQQGGGGGGAFPRSIHEIEDWCSLDKTVDLVNLVRDNAHLAVAHVDRKGSTVIHWCCLHNARDLLNVLVRRGGDIGVKDHGGRTPLHVAATFGAKRCVDALLKHGADHLALTHLGETPLTLAQENGQSDVASILGELRDGGGLFYTADSNSVSSTQLGSARTPVGIASSAHSLGTDHLGQLPTPLTPSASHQATTHYQRSTTYQPQQQTTTTTSTGSARQHQNGHNPHISHHSAVLSEPVSTANSVATSSAPAAVKDNTGRNRGTDGPHLSQSALEQSRRSANDGLNTSPQSAVSRRSYATTTVTQPTVALVDHRAEGQHQKPVAGSGPRVWAAPGGGQEAQGIRDLIAELMHQNHILDQQLTMSTRGAHQVTLCSLCDEDPKQRAAYVCEECKQGNLPFLFCESCWADEHRSKRTRHHMRAPLPVVTTNTTHDGMSSVHDDGTGSSIAGGGGLTAGGNSSGEGTTKNAVDARAVLMIQQQMLQLLQNLTPQPSMATATQTVESPSHSHHQDDTQQGTAEEILLLEDRRHERLTPMALSRAQKQHQEETQAVQILRQRLHALEHQGGQLQVLLGQQTAMAQTSHLMLGESDERLAVNDEEQHDFQELIVLSYELLAWCAMERQLAEQAAAVEAQQGQMGVDAPQVEAVLGEKHLPSQPRMLLVKWYSVDEEEWVFAADVMDSHAVVAYLRRLALSRTGTATSPDGGHTPDGTFGLVRGTTSPLGQTERDELANQLANLQRLNTAPSRGGTGMGLQDGGLGSEEFSTEEVTTLLPPVAATSPIPALENGSPQRLGSVSGILRKDSNQGSGGNNLRGSQNGVKVANSDGSIVIAPTTENETAGNTAAIHQNLNRSPTQRGPEHEVIPPPPPNPDEVPHDLQASPLLVDGPASVHRQDSSSRPPSGPLVRPSPVDATVKGRSSVPSSSRSAADDETPTRPLHYGENSGSGSQAALPPDTAGSVGSPERLRLLQDQYATAKTQREYHEARLKSLKEKQQQRDEERYRSQVHREYEEEQERMIEEQPHLNHPLTNTNDQHAALLLHKLHEEIHNAERDRELYQDFKRNNHKEGGKGGEGVQGGGVTSEVAVGKQRTVPPHIPTAKSSTPIAKADSEEPTPCALQTTTERVSLQSRQEGSASIMTSNILEVSEDEVVMVGGETAAGQIGKDGAVPPPVRSGPSYIERVVAGTASPTKRTASNSSSTSATTPTPANAANGSSATLEENRPALEGNASVSGEDDDVSRSVVPKSNDSEAIKEQQLQEEAESANRRKRVLYDQYFYQHEQESRAVKEEKSQKETGTTSSNEEDAVPIDLTKLANE